VGVQPTPEASISRSTARCHFARENASSPAPATESLTIRRTPALAAARTTSRSALRAFETRRPALSRIRNPVWRRRAACAIASLSFSGSRTMLRRHGPGLRTGHPVGGPASRLRRLLHHRPRQGRERAGPGHRPQHRHVGAEGLGGRGVRAGQGHPGDGPFSEDHRRLNTLPSPRPLLVHRPAHRGAPRRA
jgi:hypothetical protein